MIEIYYDYEEAEDPSYDPNRKLCLDYDPEVFFPPDTNKRLVRAAVAICKSCPVQLECLEDNLEITHGVVGGMTEKERDALRRRRR